MDIDQDCDAHHPASTRGPATTCFTRDHNPLRSNLGQCAQCTGIFNTVFGFIGNYGGGCLIWISCSSCFFSPSNRCCPFGYRSSKYRQFQLCFFYLAVCILLCPADGCSSRSTPKPRPPSSTTRPNITFQTYACPPAYAAWYCLNKATCFTVKIGTDILYNCECADGFVGQRCEFKDLDGSYKASQEALQDRQTRRSLSGSLVLAGVLLVVISIASLALLFTRRRTRARRLQNLWYEEEDPADYFENRRLVMQSTISYILETQSNHSISQAPTTITSV